MPVSPGGVGVGDDNIRREALARNKFHALAALPFSTRIVLDVRRVTNFAALPFDQAHQPLTRLRCRPIAECTPKLFSRKAIRQ